MRWRVRGVGGGPLTEAFSLRLTLPSRAPARSPGGCTCLCWLCFSRHLCRVPEALLGNVRAQWLFLLHRHSNGADGGCV